MRILNNTVEKYRKIRVLFMFVYPKTWAMEEALILFNNLGSSLAQPINKSEINIDSRMSRQWGLELHNHSYSSY